MFDVFAQAVLLPGFAAKRPGISLADRYATYVQKAGPDACWGWAGPRIAGGYGMLNAEGKRYVAHRWVYAQQHGPIPDGACVLHRCDSPPCTNPAHLFLGTKADNNADARAKGRAKPCDMTKRIPRDELVLLFCEGLTYAQLAGHFKTSTVHIAKALSRARRFGFHHDRSRFSHLPAFAFARAGRSTRSIAQELGVSGAAVQKLLVRSGWTYVDRRWKEGAA